jgi:hypothetical protein
MGSEFTLLTPKQFQVQSTKDENLSEKKKLQNENESEQERTSKDIQESTQSIINTIEINSSIPETIKASSYFAQVATLNEEPKLETNMSEGSSNGENDSTQGQGTSDRSIPNQETNNQRNNDSLTRTSPIQQDSDHDGEKHISSLAEHSVVPLEDEMDVTDPAKTSPIQQDSDHDGEKHISSLAEHSASPVEDEMDATDPAKAKCRETTDNLNYNLDLDLLGRGSNAENPDQQDYTCSEILERVLYDDAMPLFAETQIALIGSPGSDVSSSSQFLSETILSCCTFGKSLEDQVVESSLLTDGDALMKSPNVIHHVDYLSRTKVREAELNELRRRSLAKPKGKRLMYNHFFLPAGVVSHHTCPYSRPSHECRTSRRIALLSREAARTLPATTAMRTRCQRIFAQIPSGWKPAFGRTCKQKQ